MKKKERIWDTLFSVAIFVTRNPPKIVTATHRTLEI